ncbi:hypothetical protein Ancab_031994 [Ancistrocladus abbreviatus]
MQERLGKRVVLFPVSLEGHINPMFQLASILYSKGFSISIIHTNFKAPNVANHPNFTFLPIADRLLESDASMKDVIGLFTHFNKKCEKPLTDCLTRMISDAAVVDSLNLPRLMLRIASASSLLSLAAMPLLKEKGYFPINQDTQLEARVLELPPLKVKDIPRVGCPEALYDFVFNMCKEIKVSDGLILNSFEELEDSSLTKIRNDFGIPIFPIGPFHKLVPAQSTGNWTPDQSCISWLNKQQPKSLLYVSFGSLAAISKTEFLEVERGLANSRQPFLWVIRPGLVCDTEGSHPLPAELLEMVAERAYVVEWAPQQQVLAHSAVGGFWTHCGWNSTLESICEEVPMICLPSFAEQMVNARYVSDAWKVGEWFGKKACREGS